LLVISTMLQVPVQLIRVKKRPSEGDLISAVKKSKPTPSIEVGQEEQKNDSTEIEVNQKERKDNTIEIEVDQEEQKDDSMEIALKMEVAAYRDQRCHKSHPPHFVNREFRQRRRFHCCVCQVKCGVTGQEAGGVCFTCGHHRCVECLIVGPKE